MTKTHQRIARSTFAAATLLAAALAPTGCNLQLGSASLAEDATASVSQAQKAAGITRLATAPVREEDQGSAENAATRLENESIAGLYPAGCVTVTRENLTQVHLEFDDCTGPFGLVHLRGGIDETFSLDAHAKIVADLADSGDFTAEGQPVNYQAHAELRSLSADTAEIGWQSHWDTKISQSKKVKCDSDVTILAEPMTGCITIDGTSSASVDSRGLDMTIEGYAVCPAVCPSAGTITATGESSNETVVITFDGSDKATVNLQSGGSTQVQLVCLAL